MIRFITLLAAIALLLLFLGLLLNILPFDLQNYEQTLTSDGAFDPVTLYAISGLKGGCFIAGFILLLVAVILWLPYKNIIPLFSMKTAVFLTCIITLQFILSLIYIVNVDYVPHEDYAWYHLQASNLASGHPVAREDGTLTTYWPIGYAIILTPFYWLFGSYIIIAKVLGSIASCAITLVTYLICKKLSTDIIARYAALVTALIPSFLFFPLLPNADLPFALMVLLLVYLTLQKPTTKNTLLMAVVFGLASLTRPVILFFPLLIGLYQYLQHQNLKSTFIRLGIIFLICEAILLPWQIRNYQAFNQFVLVSANGGRHLWMGNNDHASGGYMNDGAFVPLDIRFEYFQMDEVTKDKFAFQQGAEWIFAHPIKALLIWPKKLVHMYYRDSKSVTYGLHEKYDQLPASLLMGLILLTEGYYYALGLAFLYALYQIIRRKAASLPVLLLLGTIIYITAIHMPFITEGRYHLPLLPLFVILALVPLMEKSRT